MIQAIVQAAVKVAKAAGQAMREAAGHSEAEEQCSHSA